MATLAVTDGNITLYTNVNFFTPLEDQGEDGSIISDLGISLWLIIILIVVVLVYIILLIRSRKQGKSSSKSASEDQ